MPKIGRQTWDFSKGQGVYVAGVGTVAGQLESAGPLGRDFDVHLENDRVDGDTWEHSEQSMFGTAAQIALENARITSQELDMLIGADLNAQLTSFYLGLRGHSVPALGVYSACASICEALAIGGLIVHTQHGQRVLAGTSSHTSTAERQFRYPTEYGAQKPPTAQRTATGSGVAVLTNEPSRIQITHATVGKVMDYGVTSPWEMGAAMAPSAADTIRAHLNDTGRSLRDYDCVATGDLGHIGHTLLKELLTKEGLTDVGHLTDCGVLIYDSAQPDVFSGGSGGACCSLVTFGHLLKRVLNGSYKRILVSATGALLSAVSAQQHDSIPGVSHAIAFERKDGN
ncbi:stage V sporulation protein AD [Alicyclobacillus fastidiosus]|uniref:Stage V sporulation protein AD n=1 Tax=Alicyclobacillus fastidiosus TaxID=392011 RepID=A0ABY6ZQI7_9BACL|nr:stage V sporulation protein AD [Alicyclobacillus fastidiosus]WAH44354.1 stage V sporulation protein AD [Alicyclobacillus fastidiosus]GMA60686.1 stage V sporulation protein AD [Alicyclobacillus fastidiosus]